MEELIAQEIDEPTLFPCQFPDIYYRKTPDKVSYDYMAKPDEIRTRARSQFALYEKDPNFRYILAHCKEAFPNGETRATKEAGLSFGLIAGLSRFQKCIEEDDLIAMRRNFYEPYEQKAIRWAEAAEKLRTYLSVNPITTTTVPITDSYQRSHDLSASPQQNQNQSLDSPSTVSVTASCEKPSLEQMIQAAQPRNPQIPSHQHIEKQLSLFSKE